MPLTNKNDYVKLSYLSVPPRIKAQYMRDSLAPKEKQHIDDSLCTNAIPDYEENSYLAFCDNDYPALLKEIASPPPILFYKGNPSSTLQTCIAIVGTRNPSAYGISVARLLARELCRMQCTIVSGLACGIDTIVHKESLLCANATIGVLGHGFNYCYPSENKKLYQDIEANGLLLSEYRPEQKPSSWTFPQRNRIISGISRGVIVVEGSQKSGALITARFALDQGREVFAVPGKLGDSRSEGPHRLIQQGAKLIHTIDDILSELQFLFPQRLVAHFPSLTETEKHVYRLIDDELSIDELVAVGSLSLAQLYPILAALQHKGLITELPGKKYLKIPGL